MSGTKVSKQKELPGKLHAPSVLTRSANLAKYLKLDSSARGCLASALVVGFLALGRVGAIGTLVVAFADSPWTLVCDDLVTDSLRVLARPILVKVVRFVVTAVVPGSAGTPCSSRVIPVEPFGARLFGIAGLEVAWRRTPIWLRARGTKYVARAYVVRVHH